MADYHNIEKSAFGRPGKGGRGQWVGYMDGTVWSIRKDGSGYIATERDSGSTIRGNTLREISEHLDRLSSDNRKRKGNPMATRKKKPTAAQLAARAEFARIMKSGGFAASGKRAAKRKRNPVGSKISRPASSRVSGSTKRRAAVAPVPPRAAPILRTASSPGLARARNPIYPPTRFEVWRVNLQGKAERFIGAFAAKADAVTFARIYADSHGRRVGVKIRGKR